MTKIYILAIIALSAMSSTAMKSQQVLQSNPDQEATSAGSEVVGGACMTTMKKFMTDYHDSEEECTPPIPGLSCESGNAIIQETMLTGDCCKATPYDFFLAKLAKESKPPAMVDMSAINENSVLYVIDMQNDFVGGANGLGSFKLPCNTRAQKFATAVANFMKEFAEKGGQVMLSLDYHPKDHCSFQGIGEAACKNSGVKNVEGSYSPKEGRYVNEFPPHCTFECEGEGEQELCKPTSVPNIGPDGTPDGTDFFGAKLHPTIRDATDAIKADLDKIYNGVKPVVVYKGFSKNYESFAAMPHSGTHGVQDDETAKTGGWALGNTTESTAAQIIRNPRMPDSTHRPTKAEFQDPERSGRMVSVVDILKEWETDNLYVIGLVYDFCVAETAMYAKSMDANMNVHVVADLARPAVDAKPNVLPPVLSSGKMNAAAWKSLNWGMGDSTPKPEMFEGEDGESTNLGGNPISGAKLSTVAHMEKVKAELDNAGVKFTVSGAEY